MKWEEGDELFGQEEKKIKERKKIEGGKGRKHWGAHPLLFSYFPTTTIQAYQVTANQTHTYMAKNLKHVKARNHVQGLMTNILTKTKIKTVGYQGENIQVLNKIKSTGRRGYKGHPKQL